MRVAAVQFDIAWENKPANHATVERMLSEAQIEPGTFVVLPELADTGFSFNLDAIVDDRSLAWATGLARRLGIWLQPGFADRGPDGKGRNCAAIISPRGEVVGVYHKVHPFSYGEETEHYAGGDRLLIRPCGGAAVCPLICYDLRFPELWRIAAAAGAEVFTIGASWPEPRTAHWQTLLAARAIENQAYVVGVNRVGSDPRLRYEGRSMIIPPGGDVVAEAGDGPAVLTCRLDVAALRRWREAFPALRDTRRGLLGSIPLDSTIERAETRAAPSSTDEG
ncbi:MAG: nitrilase-related carbon-nitrogen hydrolase [Planctomycetota bacterium]|jgi:predicted amidohydrolase